MTVPRLFPGATIAILGGGPSLTPAQVDAVKHLPCIAIKDAIRLAPCADVLYACDAKWWAHYGPRLSYTGVRFALQDRAETWAPVLRNTGPIGLETDPSGLRTGKNSGYQAINLAYHLGARRVLLLGYDMRPDAKGRHHWFGGHPYATVDPPYKDFLELFPTLLEPLRAAGVEVVNCTQGSALTCFRMATLAEALSEAEAAA